jgi:ATP-binding cassette subfamily F protein uup
MGILIGVQNLAKSYGSRSLFRGLSFSLSEGERVGLLGPNGAGKSTLLRLLAGQSRADAGEISTRRGLRVAFLDQVPTFPENATVESAIQASASHAEDWDFQASLQEWLSRLELDGSRGVGPHTPLSGLSGGWKKRVALARELAKQPDLLLLDEPTNHLDVESIAWLEKMLARASFACLCVTHDRLFLQRFSNRILELNPAFPDGALSVPGNYADYLEEKERQLAAQERREFVLKNTLRRETEWLRRGPKARGTKQQARIQRAGQIAEELEDLGQRRQVREVGIDFAADEARPKKLIEAKAISKSLGGRELFSQLDLLITPKSRVGLLGTNGCGKSTLIKVLLGELEPDAGSVSQADNLQVAYFEQNRESLDPKLTPVRTLCPSGDHVEYRGNPVHIRGYLDRFLFNAAQIEMPVGRLSGGEQSRLLLAKLMLRSANVLVLDEPTNDLDIVTLDLLRDSLQEFPGAVLLVTHDRFFLDEVAHQILAFAPAETAAEGEVVAFASLEQWENWREGLAEKKSAAIKAARGSAAASKKKLGYLEQREFDGMEKQIEGAEARLREKQAILEAPETASDAARLQELSHEIAALEAEIEGLYRRWSELGSRA